MICDVSKWQGEIDWAELAPALEDGYVAIKASGKEADLFYLRNVAGAVSNGVPFHAFHFLYCLTETEAKRDAGLFFRTVKEAGHWPLFWVLDCEGGWGIEYSRARPVAEAFEAELRRLARESGPGEIRVAVYIGQNRYYDYALDYDRYAYVWVPGYGEKWRPKMPCDVWQYTDKGTLPGIRGDVDLDMLIGDKPMDFFTGKTEENGGEKMNERIKSAVLVTELEAALNRGDGYIMSAYGQNPRTGYLDLSIPESQCKGAWKPTGYYYNQYSAKPKQHAQALIWRKKSARVWDCNGMAEGIYEIITGICINSKARYNYAQWCGVKGEGLIPVQYRIPGAAVFWSDSGASSIHHVAYLYKPVTEGHPEGDWYLIEARGVMYGVVKTKLLSRKPDFWGLMDKYFDYAGENMPIPAPEEPPVVLVPTLGKRNLKNGSEGADVKELQSDLIRLGYDCGRWGADGDFGDATERAVRAFQRDRGLTVDGIVGAKTAAALETAMAALNKPVEEPRQVEIEGGDCYVRTAPGTDGNKMGVAHRGNRYAYQGQTSENGWHLIEFGGKNGWVSGKYSRLV